MLYLLCRTRKVSLTGPIVALVLTIQFIIVQAATSQIINLL